MAIKDIILQKIHVPQLLESAKLLPTTGLLKTSAKGYYYLDISNEYIHQLYPYFYAWNAQIELPDYFSEKFSDGAHITLIYPEEKILIDDKDLLTQHQFNWIHAFTADLGKKRYFGLAITAPSLLALRKKYGLREKLLFKQYWVDFHITVGTQDLKMLT